ncbi:hypothetical protein DESC_740031 [Desulfosarcina cetonica]|nr:hypothetical protein DESC_740031 [Desulfosarcina cetonica]
MNRHFSFKALCCGRSPKNGHGISGQDIAQCRSVFNWDEGT